MTINEPTTTDRGPLGKTLEQIMAEQRADPESASAIAAQQYETTRAEDQRRLDAAIETDMVKAWHERIPPRFADVEMPNAGDVAGQLDSIMSWCTQGSDTSSDNVVILGPVGVGKTYLAVAMAWERHRLGEYVRFWPVVELLDALRPGGDEDAAATARDAKVLVLDDLGAERPTDWTAERLYALINRRWLNELPTIVTSNLEPNQLRTAIGERLYSRLAHEALAIRLSGVDRRRA